jgi:putative transcription factor
MQCEICGAEISGKSHHIIIDRAEMNVCDRCKGFGKEVERRGPVTSTRRGVPPTNDMSMVPVRRVRRGDLFDRMKDQLVDDYADIIKKAREAKHLTDEELAAKILEKVNIIRKVERSELVPDEALIKKLERALDIKLTEGVAEPETGGRRGDSKTLTLGDLIKVKKNK